MFSSKNPFGVDSQSIKKFVTHKNLSFDEVISDFKDKNLDVLDDERDHLNYRLFGLVVILCLGILLGRILFLQAINGNRYRSLAEGNKLRIQYVLAPRGLILDRTGKIIASNKPSFELDVITSDLPKDLAEFNRKLEQVASIVGVDSQSLSEAMGDMTPDSFSDQTLISDIAKDQALILIARKDEFSGFHVSDNAIRDYKDPLVFAHLEGTSGKITQDEYRQQKEAAYALNDYIGKNGIESEYEEFLHGTNGKRQTEVDATGNFKQTLAEVPPIPGENVRLNIDYDLQKTIYEAMLKVMEPIGKKRGAAIASNPQTGEILALVSLPSFDGNQFAAGISKDEYSKLINDQNNPLLNRAISGQYPPGSTIKPMMAVAALSEGVVTPQTKILDDGLIQVGSFTFYGYERSGLGLMDIYSAIARSSDIYFYSVGGGNPKTVVKEGLGPERIANYFRKFGLGKQLGIDLSSEKPGLVPDPAWKQEVKKEKWYLGDTYHESIGQGDVLATPLQVNSWTATIANGGKVMQPYLLDQAVGKDGEVLAEGKSKVLAENVFDPAIVKIVQDGMRQTVTAGSGLSLASLPVEISGKTGTSQFDARDLTKTHAWFTSYAPSANPQIALTVLVESGGEGHSVAVPISKLVYQWWVENRWKK